MTPRAYPGSYMVPALNTGEKFEPLPWEVYRDLLEGLQRYRNEKASSEPIPNRVRIGSFDWWREDNAAG